MRKCRVLLFLALVTLVAIPGNPETSGTKLTMTALWNNREAVRGTVTLVKAAKQPLCFSRPHRR